jgi:hypothetical protein
MSQEYFTDAQGRRVRAKHPARVQRNGVQLVLWDDIRTAPRRHMQMAFQLRRRRIAAECKQVKADVDSYNAAHPEELPIQMVLDFRRDVEEMEIAEQVIWKRPESGKSLQKDATRRPGSRTPLAI